MGRQQTYDSSLSNPEHSFQEHLTRRSETYTERSQLGRSAVRLCGPDSVVGIPTGYGLDGPGIESRWGRDFPHLSRPTLGPTQPPAQRVPGLSWG